MEVVIYIVNVPPLPWVEVGEGLICITTLSGGGVGLICIIHSVSPSSMGRDRGAFTIFITVHHPQLEVRGKSFAVS